jgi:hypothetical protein
MGIGKSELSWISCGDFHTWGSSIAGWFIRENSIQMDDDWGYPYDLGNLHADYSG